MACKESELVEAINSYAAARTTPDEKLQKLAAEYITSLIQTLEFAPEEGQEAATAASAEVVDPAE